MKIRKSVLKECIREVLAEAELETVITTDGGYSENAIGFNLWLDENREFAKYKVKDAGPYSEVQYKDIPLAMLKKHGFTAKILKQIDDNTGNYDGDIEINGNKVSVSSGD